METFRQTHDYCIWHCVHIIFVCLYFFFFFCLFYFCQGFRLSIQTLTHTCHPGRCTCFAYPGFLFKQDLQINISQRAKNTQCCQCCLCRKRSLESPVTCPPPHLRRQVRLKKWASGIKATYITGTFGFPTFFSPNTPPKKETQIDFLWALCVFAIALIISIFSKSKYVHWWVLISFSLRCNWKCEMHRCDRVTPSLAVVAADWCRSLGDPTSDPEDHRVAPAIISSYAVSYLFNKSKNCSSEFKMNNYCLHMCKIGFLWHPYFTPRPVQASVPEKNHIFDFFPSWINYMLTSSDRIQM